MLALLLVGATAFAQNAPPAPASWAVDPAPHAVSQVPGDPGPGSAPLTQTRYQPDIGKKGLEEPVNPLTQQAIQLTPPGPEQLFRLESEASDQERQRQQGRDKNPPERIVFPDEPVLSQTPYQGRNWPRQTMTVEPYYVCYGRLLFEEKNSERYGWDLGPINPFVSTIYFFKDMALLPYHLAEDPCRRYECDSGYCLPGDPVPYLLYPVNLSLSGAAAEAATIAFLLAVFP